MAYIEELEIDVKVADMTAEQRKAYSRQRKRKSTTRQFSRSPIAFVARYGYIPGGHPALKRRGYIAEFASELALKIHAALEAAGTLDAHVINHVVFTALDGQISQ